MSEFFGFISKIIENKCSHKNLYTKVHGKTIHNSQKMKTIDEWVVKQNLVHTYTMEYYLVIKNDVLICAILRMKLENSTVNEKRQTLKVINYMISFIENT